MHHPVLPLTAYSTTYYYLPRTCAPPLTSPAYFESLFLVFSPPFTPFPFSSAPFPTHPRSAVSCAPASAPPPLPAAHSAFLFSPFPSTLPTPPPCTRNHAPAPRRSRFSRFLPPLAGLTMPRHKGHATLLGAICPFVIHSRPQLHAIPPLLALDFSVSLIRLCFRGTRERFILRGLQPLPVPLRDR